MQHTLRRTHSHTQAEKLKVNIVHVGVAELLFISLLTSVCAQGLFVRLCVWRTMSTPSFMLVKDRGELHISVSLIYHWPSVSLTTDNNGRDAHTCRTTAH